MISNHQKPDWVGPFLHFGYLPRRTDLPEVIKESLSAEVRNELASRFCNDEPGLIEYGVDRLRTAFAEEFKSVRAGSHHIVPLSGGMDSRAVLIALLEHVPASRITTATFGYEGSFEVDTAQQIAATLGVSHTVFDLEKLLNKVTEEELAELANILIFPNKLLDAYINRIIPGHFGKNCVYWSGFMGDPLFGSHAAEFQEGWMETKRRFVEKNSTAKRYRISTLPIDELTTYLHEKPMVDAALLSYYEQLDFSIRQQCYIRPVVCPEGYQYQTPFMQHAWVSFTLNMPIALRNFGTYAKILGKMNYRAMALKDKRDSGKQAAERLKRIWNRLAPNTLRLELGTANHVRWDKILKRKESGLGKIFRDALVDLKKEGVVPRTCDRVLRDILAGRPGAVHAGKNLVALRYFANSHFEWYGQQNAEMKLN